MFFKYVFRVLIRVVRILTAGFRSSFIVCYSMSHFPLCQILIYPDQHYKSALAPIPVMLCGPFSLKAKSRTYAIIAALVDVDREVFDCNGHSCRL